MCFGTLFRRFRRMRLGGRVSFPRDPTCLELGRASRDTSQLPVCLVKRNLSFKIANNAAQIADIPNFSDTASGSTVVRNLTSPLVMGLSGWALFTAPGGPYGTAGLGWPNFVLISNGKVNTRRKRDSICISVFGRCQDDGARDPQLHYRLPCCNPTYFRNNALKSIHGTNHARDHADMGNPYKTTMLMPQIHSRGKATASLRPCRAIL